MRKFVLIVATAALVASVVAHAQNTGSVRYKWQDAKGLPHYSDSLTAEAMKYGYDLVNDQGMVVRHVQRQLSPQERVLAAKQAEQQAVQQRAAQDRVRADAQMLAAYPDEASFKSAQQQELDTFDQQMNTTRINLHSQEAALTELLGRAADIERSKNPVPKFLIDSIAKQRNVVAGQRAILQRQQAAHAAAQQKDTLQLQHYRELRAAQAKQQQ